MNAIRMSATQLAQIIEEQDMDEEMVIRVRKGKSKKEKSERKDFYIKESWRDEHKAKMLWQEVCDAA